MTSNNDLNITSLQLCTNNKNINEELNKIFKKEIENNDIKNKLNIIKKAVQIKENVLKIEFYYMIFNRYSKHKILNNLLNSSNILIEQNKNTYKYNLNKCNQLLLQINKKNENKYQLYSPNDYIFEDLVDFLDKDNEMEMKME